MASEKQIEANRRNSLRSSGPKTAEGKARVRINALKHGLTAATIVLPGEDAAALEARVEAWKDDLRPVGTLQDYLVERAAHVSWQLDRADRTVAARLAERMRRGPIDRAAREADEVADLARRLFWDARGPIALYPHPRTYCPHPRISWPKEADDPLDPARIVNRLEALEAGCRWLLDRWGELRKTLEDGRKWQAPDRLRAVRLLGRQPLDALDDERVLSIYLACRALDPTGRTAFADLSAEMDEDEAKLFARRAEGREVDRRMPADPAAGRAVLLAIVEQAVTRLEARLGFLQDHSSLEPTGPCDGLAFDDSDEGERLRRYQLACGRELHRTINTLFKVRKEAARDPGDDVAGPDAPGGDAPAPAPLATVERAIGTPDETNPMAEGTPPVDVPAIETNPMEGAPTADVPAMNSPEARLPAAEPPRIPAEAGTPTPDPSESRLQAASGAHRNSETNPIPAEPSIAPAVGPTPSDRRESGPRPAPTRPVPPIIHRLRQELQRREAPGESMRGTLPSEILRAPAHPPALVNLGRRGESAGP